MAAAVLFAGALNPAPHAIEPNGVLMHVCAPRSPYRPDSAAPTYVIGNSALAVVCRQPSIRVEAIAADAALFIRFSQLWCVANFSWFRMTPATSSSGTNADTVFFSISHVTLRFRLTRIFNELPQKLTRMG
jgi:hypothetical protein